MHVSWMYDQFSFCCKDWHTWTHSLSSCHLDWTALLFFWPKQFMGTWRVRYFYRWIYHTSFWRWGVSFRLNLSLLFSLFLGSELHSEFKRAITLWFVTFGRRQLPVNQGQATGCLHSLPNHSFHLGMQGPKVEFIGWWRMCLEDSPPAQIPC